MRTLINNLQDLKLEHAGGKQIPDRRFRLQLRATQPHGSHSSAAYNAAHRVRLDPPRLGSGQSATTAAASDEIPITRTPRCVRAYQRGGRSAAA